MRVNQLLISAAAGAGLYALYRYWQQTSTHLSSEVRAKVPNQKHLNTISDSAGNYDIDGVSFDSEGVIVSGDDNKHLDPMKLH